MDFQKLVNQIQRITDKDFIKLQKKLIKLKNRLAKLTENYKDPNETELHLAVEKQMKKILPGWFIELLQNLEAFNDKYALAAKHRKVELLREKLREKTDTHFDLYQETNSLMLQIEKDHFFRDEIAVVFADYKEFYEKEFAKRPEVGAKLFNRLSILHDLINHDEAAFSPLVLIRFHEKHNALLSIFNIIKTDTPETTAKAAELKAKVDAKYDEIKDVQLEYQKTYTARNNYKDAYIKRNNGVDDGGHKKESAFNDLDQRVDALHAIIAPYIELREELVAFSDKDGLAAKRFAAEIIQTCATKTNPILNLLPRISSGSKVERSTSNSRLQDSPKSPRSPKEEKSERSNSPHSPRSPHSPKNDRAKRLSAVGHSATATMSEGLGKIFGFRKDNKSLRREISASGLSSSSSPPPTPLPSPTSPVTTPINNSGPGTRASSPTPAPVGLSRNSNPGSGPSPRLFEGPSRPTSPNSRGRGGRTTTFIGTRPASPNNSATIPSPTGHRPNSPASPDQSGEGQSKINAAPK